MKAAEWDERYAAAPALWGFEPNQFARARLGALEPGRAVDLACGNGRNGVWLARRGWQVTGVEISTVALEQAAQRSVALGVQVDWTEHDALTWTPDGELDLVLVCYLHVPIVDLLALLARAGSWLAPGGRLLYVGHSRTNLERGVGGPQDPGILTEIADLAAGAHGLRVTALEHVLRATDAGTAIDILLEATTWDPGPALADHDPHHVRPATS
ncbi:MAG: class I SAM-dependent methyltransferase [Sporichthyaceae bacterium]